MMDLSKINKIEAKDVSPSWKVLQMRMNAEKADMERLQKEKVEVEGDQTTLLLKNDKKKKKKKNNIMNRKRRMEEALSNVEKDDGVVAEKKRKTDTVVLAEGRKTGELTNILALDCEYVGADFNGRTDILARVSIVNLDGDIVYDKYVKPTERITDYRTNVSGIRAGDLINGVDFKIVQMEVAKLLTQRIVVGHAINNDFRVLNLVHNRKLTRDTSKYSRLRDMAGSAKIPSLKFLAKAILGIDIQSGEHDSITDARVALRLYLSVKKEWEADNKKYNRIK